MKVELQTAKNIANLVRKEFPYESPYLLHRYELNKFLTSNKNNSDYWDKQKSFLKKDHALNMVRASYGDIKKSAFEYFKELIKAVHKYKVQNCGESARITYAVSRINQIDESHLRPAFLIESEEKDYSKSLFPEVDKMFDKMREQEYGYDGKRLDHIATQIVLDDGSKVILDSNIDKCEEIHKMEKVYKDNFGDIFGIDKNKKLQIIEGDYLVAGIPTLNDKDAFKLANLYPELILEQNHLDPPKRKYFFIDLFSLFNKNC